MSMSDWVQIGEYNTYGHGYSGDVPAWVKKEVGKYNLKGLATEGAYVELKGKTYRYRIHPLGQGGDIIHFYRKLRSPKPKKLGSYKRAAALVMKNSKILLVREKGNSSYSIPGGGINKGEPTMSAAIRELYEELKLSAYQAEYLGTVKGKKATQYVYKIKAKGTPKPNPKEISNYKWWDTNTKINVQNHVYAIKEMLEEN